MRTLPAIILTALVLAACSGREAPTAIDPNDLPFELTIPDNTPLGDYNAVSGVLVTDQLVIPPGDTVEKKVPSLSFSAQFVAHDGAELPSAVALNGNALGLHGLADTMRLANAENTALADDNVWVLTAGGDSATFTAKPLTRLDSIRPFSETTDTHYILSGAQALTLHWAIPTTGSAGIRLIWSSEQTGYQYLRDIQDAGIFTIPQTEMAKLTGTGHLQMIRYRSDVHSYNEKTLIITRLSQRNFDVDVIP